MRVISGTARGKKLLAVEGMDTRPTTDKVKEAVFNIIQFSVLGARVLDLFCGTAQMGIEALSRGAREAVFVDQNKTAADIARKNIDAARVFDRAQLYCMDFQAFFEREKGKKFDLIFLDPPYHGGLLEKALKEIELFDILSPGGIIICESSRDGQFPCPDGLERMREYQYGTIQVTIVRRKEK